MNFRTLITALFLLPALLVQAQEISFQALVDRNEIATGEALKLTIELTNASSAGNINAPDLGGLAVAHDALQRELMNKRVGEIDGYTPDQRFFMNWATVWRRNFTPDELKVRLNTDSHAPAGFRAIGAPSNMPSFAAAFQCKAGDAMVRPEDKRIAIW